MVPLSGAAVTNEAATYTLHLGAVEDSGQWRR